VSGSGISWVQICTLTQTHNHASIPTISFLQAVCPSCCPTNSLKALKARSISRSSEIFNQHFSTHHRWQIVVMMIKRTGLIAHLAQVLHPFVNLFWLNRVLSPSLKTQARSIIKIIRTRKLSIKVEPAHHHKELDLNNNHRLLLIYNLKFRSAF